MRSVQVQVQVQVRDEAGGIFDFFLSAPEVGEQVVGGEFQALWKQSR